MPIPARYTKLGQALVRAGLIDDVQLASVLSQSEQWGHRVGKAVVHMRLAKESAVVEAIASACNVAVADLRQHQPELSALTLLDSTTCRQRGVFPIAARDGGRTLDLAMADPMDLETVDHVAARTRCRVRPLVIGEHVLERAVQKFYEGKDVPLDAGDEEQAPIAELDEIKLVDIAGKTLMVTNAKVSLKNLAIASANPAAAHEPAPSSPAPAGAAPRAGSTPATASSPPPPHPTDGRALAALQAEVARMRQSQENSERWLRAIVEVLVDKQIVSAAELKAKLRR